MEDQVPPKRRRIVSVLAGIVIALVSFGLGVGVDRVVASPPAVSTQPTVTTAITVPATTSTVSVPPASNTLTSQSNASGQPPAGVADPSKSVNLAAIKPVEIKNISNLAVGSTQVGTTMYPNSVRFTCSGTLPGDVVYNVAGFKFLNATIGVPNDAKNAAGNTMSITFFKDSSTAQPLGSMLNVAVGQPQLVHLDLQGATQLDLRCAATNNTTHAGAFMDIVLGDATIGPS